MINAFIEVGKFPAIQRDSYLSGVLRRYEDLPSKVETLRVEWCDFIVSFATNETISECIVEVQPGISMVTFTRRIEALLDRGAKAEKSEWILKWSDKISRFGSPEQIRCLLFDRISSIDSETGTTIGVLKIKRRSVSSGYAKLRMIPAENELQVVCKHTSAQGLKAVWKSAVYRLKPQFPAVSASAKLSESKNDNQNSESRYGYILIEPHVEIKCGSGNWRDYLPVASRLGAEIDVESAREDGLDLVLPLEVNSLNGFGQWEWERRKARWDWNAGSYHPEYGITFKVIKIPRGEIPESGIVDYYGTIEIRSPHYMTLRKRAMRIAQWLKIDLDLPEVPADSNNFQPTAPPQEA